MIVRSSTISLSFSNATSTPEIYTLSLHDALPISQACSAGGTWRGKRCSYTPAGTSTGAPSATARDIPSRSEEHTSELQSHVNLVCRLLLEKKKKTRKDIFLEAYRQTNSRPRRRVS